MFMITRRSVRRPSGQRANRKYLDRTGEGDGGLLDKLQQPNGLFFHAPDSQFY